jgi:hypothetical protein
VGDDVKNAAKAKAQKKSDDNNKAQMRSIQEAYNKLVSAKPEEHPELQFGGHFTSSQLAKFLQKREALKQAWGDKPCAESPYVTVCLFCPPGTSDPHLLP